MTRSCSDLRAKANIGADHEHVNRVLKGDRIAAPLTNITVISKGFVLPQVTVRETPVASPIVEPALARVIGRCLS